MLNNKTKKKTDTITVTNVKVEMANPRITRSAKIAELKLDTTRIPEQPSATVSGTVDKIIPSPRPSRPEKVQIGIEGPDRGYRDIRIENSLTDEHGDDVRLKKGAHVEVTVTAKQQT
jgi:uncharacterized protein YfaS (alpha-2-macroglobulin family)